MNLNMKKNITKTYLIVFSILFSPYVIGQVINTNEYIKIYNDLYAQYSPKVKGWQLYKYDSYEKNYKHLIYNETNSNKNYVSFDNIYVVEPYLLFTKENDHYKQISIYSDNVTDEHIDSIFLLDGHPIQKDIDGKYYSLLNRPMGCDTFVIINNILIPISGKQNLHEENYQFTKNGFILPCFYGSQPSSYLIKKNTEGYVLSNVDIIGTAEGLFIHHYDETAKSPNVERQFPAEVRLSYYDRYNFLISKKGKWYKCQLPSNKENFKNYLTDTKDLIVNDGESFTYFGELESDYIRIINWESGKPIYFIAKINGRDYLLDYRKSIVSNNGTKIHLPTIGEISGDFIKPHFKEFTNNADFIEVRNGNVNDYYLIKSESITKITNLPFRKNTFTSAFIGAKYMLCNSEGKFVVEKEFKAAMTDKEIAEENSEALKTALFNSSVSERFKEIFPLKYYNGNQFIYRTEKDDDKFGRSDDYTLRIIDDSCKLIRLQHGSYVISGQNSHIPFDQSAVYFIGNSKLKESFGFLPKVTLPNIASKDVQEIGFGRSSYDKSKCIITKTFNIYNQNNSARTYEAQVKKIDYRNIFTENPDVENEDIISAMRLSNNEILVVIKAEMRFLSNQLNSIAGIDGVNNISRVFASDWYYKFIVISEDGSELISNKNYLLPFKKLIPIDGGFIAVSNELADLISLDNKDFGRKTLVHSKELNKDILVTESINFNNAMKFEKGIKLFKFDNSANLVKELIIDNSTDPKITKPELRQIKTSENYICLSFSSYDKNVINVSSPVFSLYDLNLNLKSELVDPNILFNWGILASKDDTFYLYKTIPSESIVIPFNR